MIGRPPATTHWAIRNKAMELFARDGYANTSLVSIAHECGISRTTLFAYFRTKTDIFVHGDERNFQLLLSLLQDAPSDVPVGSIVRSAVRTMRTLPSNVREELAVYWHIVDENPDVAARAAHVTQRYCEAIAEFVSERLGTAPADPMPAVLAEAVAAARRAVARHWTSYRELGPSLEDAVASAVAPVITAYLGDR